MVVAGVGLLCLVTADKGVNFSCFLFSEIWSVLTDCGHEGKRVQLCYTTLP